MDVPELMTRAMVLYEAYNDKLSRVLKLKTVEDSVSTSRFGYNNTFPLQSGTYPIFSQFPNGQRTTNRYDTSIAQESEVTKTTMEGLHNQHYSDQMNFKDYQAQNQHISKNYSNQNHKRTQRANEEEEENLNKYKEIDNIEQNMINSLKIDEASQKQHLSLISQGFQSQLNLMHNHTKAQLEERKTTPFITTPDFNSASLVGSHNMNLQFSGYHGKGQFTKNLSGTTHQDINPSMQNTVGQHKQSLCDVKDNDYMDFEYKIKSINNLLSKQMDYESNMNNTHQENHQKTLSKLKQDLQKSKEERKHQLLKYEMEEKKANASKNYVPLELPKKMKYEHEAAANSNKEQIPRHQPTQSHEISHAPDNTCSYSEYSQESEDSEDQAEFLMACGNTGESCEEIDSVDQEYEARRLKEEQLNQMLKLQEQKLKLKREKIQNEIKSRISGCTSPQDTSKVNFNDENKFGKDVTKKLENLKENLLSIEKHGKVQRTEL